MQLAYDAGGLPLWPSQTFTEEDFMGYLRREVSSHIQGQSVTGGISEQVKVMSALTGWLTVVVALAGLCQDWTEEQCKVWIEGALANFGVSSAVAGLIWLDVPEMEQKKHRNSITLRFITPALLVADNGVQATSQHKVIAQRAIDAALAKLALAQQQAPEATPEAPARGRGRRARTAS